MHKQALGCRAVNQAFWEVLLTEFRRLFHFWHQRQKIPKEHFQRRMLRIKRRILALAAQQDLPGKSTTLAKRFRKHVSGAELWPGLLVTEFPRREGGSGEVSV